MATITTDMAHATVHGRRERRRAIAAAIAATAAVIGSNGNAAEWRFTPTVSATETYTDNVSLATRGLERSDLVTQISPGLSVTANGPRLKLRANYQLQGTTHLHSNGSSELSNVLDGSLTAEFVEDLFYIDARANISQQNISAFGPQSTNNININNNRADVRTYGVSPYLRHNFGNRAFGELRYAHDSVGTSSNLLATSNTDRLSMVLNSGEAFQKISWGLRASTQKSHSHDQRDVNQDLISGSVRYFLNPHFSVTATGGYEKANYATLAETPSGTFYTAGFIWKPTSRTDVSVTAGHRYFGQTYSLLANHRARHSVFNVSYTEDITTAQQQFSAPPRASTAAFLDQLYTAQIPDPAARQQVIDALIRQTGLASTISNPNNSLTNTYFLQKSLQASVAVSGARNTVVVSAFDSRRTAQSAQQASVVVGTSPFAALNDNNKQLGLTALWNVQLASNLNGLASLNTTRTTALSTARVDNYKAFRLGVTQKFAQKLSGSVELRHSQQNSDVLGGDIRENALTASLLMQF